MSEEKSKEEKKQKGKGSVYLKPEMGFDDERVQEIRVLATRKGMRGFSDLVRSIFDRPTKFFTGLFTDSDPKIVESTLEVFGDLEMVDGRVRIRLTDWSDEDVLSTRRGLKLLVNQFDEEVSERGLTEEETEEEEPE